MTLIPQVQRAMAGLLEPSLLVWPAMFLGQATLIPVCWRLHVVAQLLALGSYLVLDQVFQIPSQIPLANLSYFGLWMYLAWICLICNLCVYLYERLRRSEFTARQQLEEAYHRITEEQERSERLLLNILPYTIAKRLKEQTEYVAIADSFSHAGVLFADIVGFTALSTKVSPPELVQLLNEIFSEFDRLADLHGLEKNQNHRRCLYGGFRLTRGPRRLCRGDRRYGLRYARCPHSIQSGPSTRRLSRFLNASGDCDRPGGSWGHRPEKVHL